MTALQKLIRPISYGRYGDAGILFLRFAPAFFMAYVHGWDKLIHFEEYSKEFYNFMGLGDAVSLGLTVFAEFFCSVLIIIGLFTRLAAIPLLITMGVVVFDVGFGNPIYEVETPLLYMIIFMVLFITGAGRYSLDYSIYGRRDVAA